MITNRKIKGPLSMHLVNRHVSTTTAGDAMNGSMRKEKRPSSFDTTQSCSLRRVGVVLLSVAAEFVLPEREDHWVVGSSILDIIAISPSGAS